MFGLGVIRLIILNEGMNDVMKIVWSFEESSSLIKTVSKTFQNKDKNESF